MTKYTTGNNGQMGTWSIKGHRQDLFSEGNKSILQYWWEWNKKNTQLNNWTVQRISLKFLHVSSQFRLKWVLARYTCPLIFFFVKIPRIKSKKLTFSSFLTFFQCDRLNIKKIFPDDWRFFSHDNPLPHLACRTWRKRK